MIASLRAARRASSAWVGRRSLLAALQAACAGARFHRVSRSGPCYGCVLRSKQSAAIAAEPAPAGEPRMRRPGLLPRWRDACGRSV
jgi:hypothetical protein